MTFDRSPAPTARLTEPGLLLALPLWLTGWTVMRLGGHRGPGLGWSVAHGVWIVAILLLGGGCIALYRRGPREGRGRAVASTALGTSLVGTAALVGQLGCDLVVGLRSADRTAMSDAYDRVFAVPGVQLALFQVGPALLFAGLLVLVVLAFRTGRASSQAVALVVVGIIAQVAGKPLPGWWRVVEGLGGACLWWSLASIARISPTTAITAADAAGQRGTASTARATGA